MSLALVAVAGEGSKRGEGEGWGRGGEGEAHLLELCSIQRQRLWAAMMNGAFPVLQ